MSKILDELIAREISAEIVLEIQSLIEDAGKWRNRRERIKRRMRLVRSRALTPSNHSTKPVRSRALTPPHTPPLSLTDVPIGTSVRARDKLSTGGKRKPKTTLQDDWNPLIAPEDRAELERFKDHARAHGSLYANWDAAWRNWRTSPYRKANAGHANGNGRAGSILATADKLIDHLNEQGAGEYVPGSSGPRPLEMDRPVRAHGIRGLPKG